MLVVCPADQAIGDQDAYLQAIRVAVQAVESHMVADIETRLAALKPNP